MVELLSSFFIRLYWGGFLYRDKYSSVCMSRQDKTREVALLDRHHIYPLSYLYQGAPLFHYTYVAST